MATAPPILFNPTPDLAAAVIAAMTDPALSLDHLAQAARTSSEALSLWMQRPDIRERIESTDRAATWRTRLIASSNLYAATPALVKILQDFARSPSPTSPHSSPPHSSPASNEEHPTTTFRARLLDARRAETTRKSAALLFNLSKARPTAGPDLPHAQSAPGAREQTESPVPQSASIERPEPKSLDTLLSQLAPHLEVIAKQLGIDTTPPPKEPLASARGEAPQQPPTHQRQRPTPPRNTREAPAPNTHLDSPEPILTAPHEHWP